MDGRAHHRRGPRARRRVPHPARPDRQRRHDPGDRPLRGARVDRREPARRLRRARPAVPVRPAAAPRRPSRRPRWASTTTPPTSRATPPTGEPHAGGRRRAAVRRPARPRPDRVLGRPAVHPRAGDAGRRGPPHRVDGPARRHPPARRPALLRARLVGAVRDLLRPQHQQEERHPRPRHRAGPGAAAPADRDLRRPRRELHAAGARAARASTSTPSGPSGPTSSWSGCPASGSTARGATTRPSPS